MAPCLARAPCATSFRHATAPLVFVGHLVEASGEEGHVQAVDLSDATRAQETQILLGRSAVELSIHPLGVSNR